MEAIKISSFGRNEIQNAEWYANSIEELAATEGSCIGDKGYLLVENMPMYIKKDNNNDKKDWQFVGNKYGSSGGTGGSSALSEAETLALLVETDVVQPAANEQNEIYTDEYDRTFVL